jgi:phosphonate transport system substrate-binding protein
MTRRSAGVLAALSLGVILLQGCSEREAPQRVRLWALAPPEVTAIERGGRAPLRLAVALTISPQEGYQLYGDLAEALGQKIGRPVHLILRRTFSEVNDLARSRQAEAVHLCSRGFLQGLTDFGLTAIAVPVVTGRTRHPSYVIVSAESEIGSPGELKGKTFAFADPLCAPEPFPTGRGAPPPDGFFKRRLAITSHDRAVRAVAEGLADGALVDGLVYGRLAVTDPALTAKTKVIEATAPYLNPPIAAHPGLDPALRESLRRALLTFHEEPAGRTVLSRLGIERFVAPPREAGEGGR